MNFNTYMKKEIEKVLFIEMNEELTLNMEGYPVLLKGEYPILPADFIKMGMTKSDALTPSMLIDGMIYVIACDKAFIYNKQYIEFLKSVKAIESYIIMKINEFPEKDQKKKLIYVNALVQLYPKQEYLYNRVIILMKLYEKNKQDFIENEIVESLESLTIDFPDYMMPNFRLGEYYLDKDLDKAKLYLRRCLEDDMLMNEAYNLLEAIRGVENYDEAVEYVRNGHGAEALKILLPIIESDYDRLDAKYYAAIAYRQTGNSTKALIYLKELTEIAERAEVYSEIGINLAELEDFEGALEYFKKALKITPDDAGIICNIGACHLNLAQFIDARKMFELASRLNPADDIPQKWLAIMKQEEH